MPESPDTVRGGDTSLFSLPSESANTTPHTSNVSVTTTITSAISPARNLRPMGGQNVDSVRLRRTLEATATLLDRLSKACSKLQMASNVSNEVSILAAEEVKRVYLQLLAIKTDDLNSLINSFELDIPPMQITRIISDDHGDAVTSAPNLCHPGGPVGSLHRLPPQFTNHQMSRNSGSIFDSNFADEQANPGPSWIQADLFSPSTNDMNSLDNTTYVQDDLRRTVGSFDRDETNVENIGRRDEPPQGTYLEYNEQQQHRQNMQQKKHKRGRHRGSSHRQKKEAAE